MRCSHPIPAPRPIMLPPPLRRGPAARVRPALRLLTLACAAACGRGGGGSQVTFAVAGPLRQDYGIATKQGADLAVKEINAAGGIDGRTLVLLPKDDGADAHTAITIAAELVRGPNVVALA